MAGKEVKSLGIKETLKIYFGFLKKYKLLIAVILFLVFILETRHILDSYLFKVLVDNGTSFAAGVLSKSAFISILLTIAGVFAIIVVSGFIGRWFQQHFVNLLSSKVIIDIKRKYFNHLIDLDHSFHASHKTGTLISKLSRVNGAVEEVTEVLTYNIASMIFGFIVGVASLIYFDLVSAIIITGVIIVFVGYGYFIESVSQKANVAANEVEDIEKGDVSDMFTNIESIKYFGKENTVKRKFMEIISNTKDAFMKHWGYFRWLDSVHSITIGIGAVLLIYFSVTKFINGEMSLGTIVFIYSVYESLIEPLYGFVYGLRGLYGATADFQTLFGYGKIEKEIKDKPNAENLEIKEGAIEFRDVSFNYGNRKIFKDFNLKIPPEKKIAFVGSSGSGKTTIIKLLYRFYDINSGEILIDGKDIREFKQESVRSGMSIVPQECILFDDTIYNNIAFSKSSASKQEIMDAMKFAQLDKVIENLPEKENTIVGERGIKLSGGEKQRVSIARAILADKKILILDEATSALDSETEFEIQKDMARLMKGRTSIIIAHRLSTIMNADKIIVLKNGEIIQSGKHSDLVEEKGEYQRLWNLQKEGNSLAEEG